MYCRRQVATRTVANGSAQNQWTYSIGVGNAGGNSIITDPLGNDEVHVFAFVDVPAGTSASSFEQDVRSYRGSSASGTLLRTVHKDYAAEAGPVDLDGYDYGLINIRVIRETTTLDDGQQSKVETDFDTSTFSGQAAVYTFTRLNVTERREYAFGAGAPGPLLRRTANTYLHTNNSTYQNLNIADRVAGTIVYDGAGNIVAQTQDEYDNYTQPIQSTDAVQHDSNFNSSYLTRGNVTAVSRWRNTDAAWLTSRNQYDDVGNVLSTTDPLGNTTQFDYSDAFGNATCAPASGSMRAFLKQSINPLTQASSFTHNSCTGTVASATDLNSKTTTFTYDSLNRRTLTIFPDGGQATNAYDDTQLIVTSGRELLSPSTFVYTRQHFDGLGRVFQSELCEDGTTTCAQSVKTDTTFDALSRTATVSNPHRGTPSSTDGITTFVYDALNRQCVVVAPDGTAVSGNTCPASPPTNDVFTAYSGNSVTVTDQAGKQRRSFSDALGRLIEVDEPGGGSPATPGTGSATMNGSEQSAGGAAATPGTGSATVSGSEKSIAGAAATSGTGSVTISGSEQFIAGGCGRSCSIYDIGGVQITVNGYSKIVNYGQGSSASTIATAMVNALNGDTSSPVTASSSFGTVTLTSKATGTASNYSLSATSWTNDPTDFGGPSFTTSTSGATLTGGTNGTPSIYDSGSVWVSVNEATPCSTTYGQGSTTASLATALASAINSCSTLVNATASGATVNLTAKTTGANTNYSLSSGSSTSQPGTFSSPSFTVSVSGAAMTGGANAVPATYDTGSVWATINGTQCSATYGQSSTTTSLATALASVINSCSILVNATPSGATVNLVAKTSGAATNYSLSSGSSTSQPGTFTSPSFTVSVSGLSGGADTVAPNLGTPAVTLYAYDALSNLTRVDQKGNDPTPANWRTRTFTYNSLSQLLTANNPESGTITYAYDNNGNLLTKISPAPNQTGSATVTTTFTYDALNRLTQKSFSDGTTPTVKYGYDAVAPAGCTLPTLTINNGIGKRTGMCDAAGSEAWSYDITANIGWKTTDVRTTNGVTKTTIVQSNLAGAAATLTYPSGRILSYAYNSAAQPLSAIDNLSVSYASGALYAPTGALASLVNGSSVTSTLFYDKRLQPCRISVTTSATLPSNCGDTTSTGNVLDYNYNFSLGASDNGNVTGIINNRDTARSQSFTYDTLNRLATAQTTSTNSTSHANCWAETYTYDAWGNLYAFGANSATQSAYIGCLQESGLASSANSNNRLSGYSYDAAGNMTNAPGAGSSTYNAENQLVSAASVTYTYDGDGKRVSKSNGKLYWYGMSSDPLDETDLSGATNNSGFNEFVFFGGKRIAKRDSSNTVSYYFADHLGTARVVTNSTGAIQDDSDFYPFGGERPILSSSGNTYKFTSKERDAESGLDNFGARYDSSSLGRFMSIDPSRVSIKRTNPQSWNRYTYALNNPLSYVDQNGLWPTWVHNAIYEAAFSGVLTGHQISVLEKASHDVDYKNGGQKPENSNRHSMCVPGQSVAACSSGIMGNINGSISKAKQTISANEGKLSDDAITALAPAEHGLTDMGSPQHVSADGTPITWTGAFWPGVSHVFGEFDESVDWGRVGQSVRLAIAGYLQACQDQDCPNGNANADAWAQQSIERLVSTYFAIQNQHLGADPEGFRRESSAIKEEATRQCALGNPAACH